MKEIKEYAEALYSLACEEEIKDEITKAVREVEKIFEENPQYVEMLSSPAIELSTRIDMLGEAFSSFIPEYMLSFLKLLCEKGYIRRYRECAEQYNKLVEFSEKISVAKVKSAVELTNEEVQALLSKLERKCGHKVELELSVEKELLGGLVIEIDGRIIDASLNNRLKEIKEVIGR